MPQPDHEDLPRDRSETGDLYVFDDQDLADICAELYVHLHLQPGLTRTEAMQLADTAHKLMTGDWLDE